MTFHNSKLREISLHDQEDSITTVPRETCHVSASGGTGTGTGRQTETISSFFKQEETPDKKRKREETLKSQIFHNQPASDSARAADMDNIHFSQSFNDFDYTSANAYIRNEHFHIDGNSGEFHPRIQSSGDSSTFHNLDESSAFYNHDMPASSGLAQSLSRDTLIASSSIPGSFFADRPNLPHATNEDIADIKHEEVHETYTVSATLAEESDFAASEFEEERSRKTLKVNKDGAPRKPRQPRPKLLKWSDEDWKNVCLGIVWACGETGVQIPFDQAAQVVGEKCTAGALQQALLKLRCKQIAEGHQIPNLKMAWTRKNKYAMPNVRAKSSQEPEANKLHKNPTRMEATQSLIITLPRAYNGRDRQSMGCPYKWKKPPRKARSSAFRSLAEGKQGDLAKKYVSSPGFTNDFPQHQNDLSTFPYIQTEIAKASQPAFLNGPMETHILDQVARSSDSLKANPTGGIQGDIATYDHVDTNGQYSSPVLHYFESRPLTPTTSQSLPDYLPSTPMTGGQCYHSPPETPFSNNTGFLQDMVIGGGGFSSLLNSETLQEYGNGFADATDDVFTI